MVEFTGEGKSAEELVKLIYKNPPFKSVSVYGDGFVKFSTGKVADVKCEEPKP